MTLDCRKDIQSVKSARSSLHAELKVHALPSLQGNNERRENIHKHIQMHTYNRHIPVHFSNPTAQEFKSCIQNSAIVQKHLVLCET